MKDFKSFLLEKELTDKEKKKREEVVKALKKNKDDLKKRYGDKWKSVMYAIATEVAKRTA